MVDVHDVVGIFGSDIVVERLDESGELIETLIDDAESDKTRFLSVIELSAPETLRLRFREEAFGDDSAYTFGIFADGDPVPSPFFTDCPMVIPASAGDEVTFEFARGFENEAFLAVGVDEIRRYELAVVASDLDPLPFAGPLVQFEVELVDEYGELGSGESHFGNRILGFNATESPVRGTASFSPRRTGLNWIRFHRRLFPAFDGAYAVQASLMQDP